MVDSMYGVMEKGPVVYGVRVCLTDGQKFEFKNATNYEADRVVGTVRVEVNGYNQIFNMQYVLYVGRIFDLDGANT